MSRNAAVVVCAAAMVLPGALAGCSSGPATPAASAEAGQAGIPMRVGVEEFATLTESPDVRIIDVRTPAEFADGHIDGATNIPVQSTDFSEQVAALDPTGTYAVYCRSGNRSQPAVAAMREAGIDTIYELRTGTRGWISGGQELVR